MREYFRGLKFVLVIIIVAFVGTSVVYFGSSAISGLQNKPNVVATVNGEEIPSERFRRAQQNVVENYERMAKQRLTPEMAERLGISQQVMNELVTDVVIVQGAAREGVQVTDEELRSRIQEMREFQEDGRFSRDRYLRILRQVRLEPAEFESEMRRQVARRKIEALVRDGVKVSDAEVRDVFQTRYEKVRAAWASLDVQPLMAAVTVADADLEPYIKSHQAQLTRPERRRLQYVLLSPAMFARPVTDQEVETYYSAHGSEFEEPRRMHLAHILVRVPTVGGSEAESKTKAKVEAVIKRAQSGEDFAKLAKENSEDTSNAAQGGDLGFVGPGDLVAQFEQAAFALKKGEISPTPVRTPFGYHAIKVLDIKEGGKKSLKDVAGQIRDKLANEQSDTAARAKAAEVRTSLIGAADFAAQARAAGLAPREATIARGEALEGIGREPELEEAVFSLALGGVSAPIKTHTGYAIVKVNEQIPAGVPPLAEIKPRVVEAIKRERAEAQAVDRARALIASIGKGGDFLAAAKAGGFSTGELPWFSRAEPPKDKNTVPGSVVLAALQTSAGQVSEPIKTGTAVYVVKVAERQPADPQEFDKQRAELEKQLLDQKKTQVWDAWVRAQRASMKIDVAAGMPSARN
jgi:peptidyl-prolyl cis-trans isomerase D